MKNIHNIYRPKPTILQWQDDLIYKEYLPSKELQPYISCYWSLKSKKYLNIPIKHRVIPDGCTDIIIHLNENKLYAEIYGVINKVDVFFLTGNVNSFGIRFLPSGSYPFFRIPLSEFANRSSPVDSIFQHKELILLNEHYPSLSSDLERISFIEKLLVDRLIMNRDFIYPDNIHSIMTEFIALTKSNLNIRLNDIHEHLGIHSRTLNRYFQKHIGISPKSLIRTIRFQELLTIIKNENEESLNMIKNVYYDQSHLLHEINDFYGMTYNELLKSLNR